MLLFFCRFLVDITSGVRFLTNSVKLFYAELFLDISILGWTFENKSFFIIMNFYSYFFLERPVVVKFLAVGISITSFGMVSTEIYASNFLGFLELFSTELRVSSLKMLVFKFWIDYFDTSFLKIHLLTKFACFNRSSLFFMHPIRSSYFSNLPLVFPGTRI